MSEEQKGMIDFSDYQGDYQEGELLAEDGTAIDMEDLKGDKPATAPLIVKIVGLLVSMGLGAFGYWTFIHKAPPPPKKPQAIKVKRNKTLDRTLEKVAEVRKKDFKPLARCWDALSRGQTKKLKVTTAILAKACPALKAGAMVYKPHCADATCAKVQLHVCKGAACTPEPKVSYYDFVQMMMVRVSDGHNRLMARLRMYQKSLSAVKSARRKKTDDGPALNRARRIGKSIIALLKGKGQDPKKWESSYLTMTPAALFASALKEAQKVLAGPPKPKADDDPPKKAKKRRRRRRRKRRRRRSKKKKKSADDGPLWAGTHVVTASWPFEGSLLSSYRSVDEFTVGPFDGGIPFRIEKRADDNSVDGNFDYTPVTAYFWTSLLLKPTFIECAYKHAKGKTYTAEIKSLVNTKLGRFYTDGVKMATVTPPNPTLSKCLTFPIRKNKLQFGYRGMAETPEKRVVHFRVIIKP